jgi:hypothetical protein
MPDVLRNSSRMLAGIRLLAIMFGDDILETIDNKSRSKTDFFKMKIMMLIQNEK